MSERTYAPRSGGRTTEQRGSHKAGDGARGARRNRPADDTLGATQGTATQGTAALKVEVTAAEPLRVGRTPGPRLRVAPPAPISAPRAPFVAVMIAVVIAGLIGILLINTRTNENTFRISKLQDQKAALDNQQQQLENQIVGYESIGNLDAAARRLGLVKADNPAYIRMPDGRVLGVPKPGNGPTAVTAQDPQSPGTPSAGAQGDADAQNGVTAAGTTPGGDTTDQSAGR
jgi:hypothetical protein